ncbi:hypothetical protein P9112_003969 [Eukaryota sp. TZLM1-RC]
MSVFVPHMDNIGGRDLLTHERFNHISSLNTTRNRPSSRPSSAVKPISEKSARDLNNRLCVRGCEYDEVFETYRRVSKVKSRIDNKPPVSLKFRNNCSNRRRRLNKTVHDNHSLEVYHLQRRMATTHSLTNRKKNSLDHTINPSYLMRRTPRKYSVSDNQMLMSSRSESCLTNEDYSSVDSLSQSLSSTFLSTSSFSLPPLANVRDANELAARLSDCVVSQRLYKDEHLLEIVDWVHEHDNIDYNLRQAGIELFKKEYLIC